MKYDLSQEEFIKVYEFANRFVDKLTEVMTLSIQNHHEIALRRLTLEQRRLTHEMRMNNQSDEFTQPFEKKEDLDEDSFVEEASPKTEEERIFKPQKPLTDHQAKGKDFLEDMIEIWLKGFRKDDEPQPNRGDFMKELAGDGHRAGAIVSYCMSLGGLTRACWNISQELYKEGTIDEEYATAESVRYLAGNICQVASVHLGPLADEFEYPNPIAKWSQS